MKPNTLKIAKRTKAQHREYVKEKKQAEEKTQKEIREEIWAQHQKSLSVKPGDVIYEVPGEWKLWFVTFISYLLVAVVVFLVNLPSRQQLLADFGTMFYARLFQVGMCLASGIFLYVMYFLMHHKYVLSITLMEDKALQFKLWGLFGHKKIVYPKEAWVAPVQYHEGRTQLPYAPSVNAPYESLRPYGKKSKFILNSAADYPFGTNVLYDIIEPEGE